MGKFREMRLQVIGDLLARIDKYWRVPLGKAKRASETLWALLAE
jgi:hypothetical protein